MDDGRTNARRNLTTEQLFGSLFQHMAEGVALHEVVVDGAGKAVNYRILDVNPQYERYTGLAPDRVIGKLATEAYGTPTPPYLHEFTSVGLGGPPTRLETHFAPLNRHYEISVAPLGPGFFATIFLDVSERRRQEAALQRKTEELDRFFNITLDLLCIANTEGQFLRVNAAWTVVLGWSVAELEGARFLDLVHPDDLASTLVAVQALSGGQQVIDFTNRYRAKDGSYRFIEWRSAPAPGGLIYAAARDVTHRFEAESALRASEERFRRIFELVPNPLTVADAQGTMLDCNEAFCQTSGYTREEVLGRKPADLGMWRDIARRDLLVETLRRTGYVHNFEMPAQDKDGKPQTLLLSVRMLEIAGQPAMVAASQNVTEQRRLEQQMLHSQKLESLGVLAGGIAHDFNNLLTGILGNADLALLDLSPVSPARESLTAIGSGARRAAELCRQLLAYSGKGRFQVQPIDLAELVQEMGHLLSISISKKVVLKYHFASHLPAVEADATQMRQVVMNLIVNASEAIGERSGVVSVTTGLGHCDAEDLKGGYCAESIQPGDFVYLEIEDTGRGMDQATLDRIFDPFFTTKFTGRGLGLAAVLGIVRGHHGAIRVRSEPGRGTTFKLLFPPSAASISRAAGPTAQAAPWRGRGQILVVDDEEPVRTLSRRMLERSGFSVITAADGREALEKFGPVRHNIALVLLDLTMPHLGGEACFHALRQMKADVKVVLSSGYSEQDVVTAFAGKGLAGFIQKPYTTDELLAKVREILDPTL